MDAVFAIAIIGLVIFAVFKYLQSVKTKQTATVSSPTAGTMASPTVTVSYSGDEPYIPAEDRRTNFCPNCGVELKKVPGAKTKCPHCSKFMYVRTDPRINARVVVSEADLEEVDDEIAKVNGTWEERLRKRNWRNEIAAKWASEGKQGMRERDLEWDVLNREGIFLAGQGQWGAWRNNELDKANLELKNGNYKSSYLHFCVVGLADYMETVNLFGSKGQNGDYMLAMAAWGMQESQSLGHIADPLAQDLISKAAHIMTSAKQMSDSDFIKAKPILESEIAKAASA